MRSKQRPVTKSQSKFEFGSDLYLQLLDNLPQNMYLTDTKGRIIFANQCYCKSLGMRRAGLIGKTVFDLFPRKLACKYAADDRKVLRQKIVLDIVETNQPRYRASVQVRVIKVPILNEKGQAIGVQGIWWDISRQQETFTRMAEQSYFLSALMENLPDNVYFKDTKSRFLLISKTMAKHLGVNAPKEAIGKTDFDFFTDEHAKPAFRDERQIIRTGQPLVNLEEKDSHADGRTHWVSTTKVPLRNQAGEIVGTFGLSRDITDRKRAEELLHRRAFYDPLTELPNRALFMDRLRHLFRQRQRNRRLRFAVLFLDLDGFKHINDTLGHEAGDEVLVSVSRCFSDCVRPGDTVARLGGDEFTILLEGTRADKDAERVARRILKSISNARQLKGHNSRVSVSIGVANVAPDATSPEELLRDADAAMYCAKFKGKSQFQTFSKIQHRHNDIRNIDERSLQQALKRNEFQLLYQPIVDAKKNRIVGVEALLRWLHPQNGLLEPEQFLDRIEDSNVLVDLGIWVLRQATTQIRAWQSSCPAARNLFVGVNVTGKQLLHDQFVESVRRVLKESKLSPQFLHLEIPEDIFHERLHSLAAILARLRKLSVKIDIDNVGRSFLNIGEIAKSRPDAIQLDRSLVRLAGRDRIQAEVFGIVAQLAVSLGVEISMEGVESKRHLKRLKQLPVSTAQGFYFSKPLPPIKLEQLLRSGKLPRASINIGVSR